MLDMIDVFTSSVQFAVLNNVSPGKISIHATVTTSSVITPSKRVEEIRIKREKGVISTRDVSENAM